MIMSSFFESWGIPNRVRLKLKNFFAFVIHYLIACNESIFCLAAFLIDIDRMPELCAKRVHFMLYRCWRRERRICWYDLDPEIHLSATPCFRESVGARKINNKVFYSSFCHSCSKYTPSMFLMVISLFYDKLPWNLLLLGSRCWM